MAHKLSFACAERILSYHLLPQLIFFTHKLVTVTSLLCGLCWCLLFACVGFCFLCFVVLFPRVLFLSSNERDSTYCRGTSKCLQSCWGLEKLVLVS